jgi:hypothetical protein
VHYESKGIANRIALLGPDDMVVWVRDKTASRTGRLYQQFAVTIAVSVLLSAFNALTLSPALAALLLRPKQRPA